MFVNNELLNDNWERVKGIKDINGKEVLNGNIVIKYWLNNNSELKKAIDSIKGGTSAILIWFWPSKVNYIYK